MPTRALMATLVALLFLIPPTASLPPEAAWLPPAPAEDEAASYPTPGINCELSDPVPVVGRYFPEAFHTNDYIGYFEAVQCLERLASEHPDTVELLKIGKSLGWVNTLTGQREGHDILLVEVTNKQSPVPNDQKIQLLFSCSIHGNEKGGREGCLRVIEDFARGMGVAADRPDLPPLLDYMLLIFLFPNVDGWTHNEPQYVGNIAVGPLYTRGNANGTDLNRQWPTMGYMQHRTFSEPEIRTSANYLREHYDNIHYAIDIHGMLQPANAQSPPSTTDPTEFQEWLNDNEKGHFLLTMLPGGQMTQNTMIRQTRLAELIRERANDCPWLSGAAWCNSPDVGPWGGSFNQWGTVWESIGYLSSGTTSIWMVSPTGANAAGYSVEMSYNHMVCDGFYLGCGQPMNDYHISAVRLMVATFMDTAKIDFQVSIETNGIRAAYLFNPLVVTNLDENGNRTPSGGWADEIPWDDPWDVNHNTFIASPNDYLRDFGRHVRHGDRPGVFDEVTLSSLDAELLARYDAFAIPGSAYTQLQDGHKQLLKEWVERGGRLVVTDGGLQLIAELGAIEADAVRTTNAYAGYTRIVNAAHDLAKDRPGFGRQTYEPVPLGIAQGSAPIWTLRTPAVLARGGDVVGVLGPASATPATADHTNYGALPLGAGTIAFLGALLPDPTYELYTPYGVSGYGVTYAGNHYFMNLLGFGQVFAAPPRVLEDVGSLRKVGPSDTGPAGPSDDDAVPAGGGRSPGPGVVLSLLVLALAGAALRDRGGPRRH